MYAIIKQTGFDAALAELRSLGNAVKDTGEIIQRAGEYVLDFLTNDVFESEGKVFGHGWPELSMPYAYRKFLKYGPQLTLVASGQMRASNALYTTGNMITIKNNARNKQGKFYAQYHQDGGGNLPQRMLYDLDDERQRRVGEIIMEGIDRRVSRG